jgi:hypothetical protein
MTKTTISENDLVPTLAMRGNSRRNDLLKQIRSRTAMRKSTVGPACQRCKTDFAAWRLRDGLMVCVGCTKFLKKTNVKYNQGALKSRMAFLEVAF